MQDEKNWPDRRTAVDARPQLFAGLSPAEYAQASAAARIREFPRGQLICVESEPVRQVILVTSGLVKLTKLGMGGDEVILRLGVPGDVLGGTEQFSTGRYCTTVQAFRPCRTLVWEPSSFKALVARFPVMHQNMLRILFQQLHELEGRFRELATEKVGARVASQLVRLLETIGRPANGAVEIDLSRDELARMTGTTLYSVSRFLSAWEAQGIVVPRREGVTIRDVPRLEAISCDAKAGVFRANA